MSFTENWGLPWVAQFLVSVRKYASTAAGVLISGCEWGVIISWA